MSSYPMATRISLAVNCGWIMFISARTRMGTSSIGEKRRRKLLAHRREIDKLIIKLRDAGVTLVPLKMYFKGSKVKLLIGLARGKKSYDKRQAIKERDAKREVREKILDIKNPVVRGLSLQLPVTSVSMNFPPLNEQMDAIRRGAVDLISEEELAKKIERSRAQIKPLIVKLGADPSTPDLHIGHGVVLRKLRAFQDLGIRPRLSSAILLP